MQVKKFEAPTMQEALKVIKRELGPEAIILSTKHIKSGFGLMSKASVEVTAAIAEKDLKKKMMAEKNLPDAVKEKIWNSKAEKQAEIYDDYFEKQLKRAGKDKVEIGSARRQRGQQQEEILAPKTAARSVTQQPSAPTPSHANMTLRVPAMAASAPVARQSASRMGPSAEPSPSTERRYVDIMDEEGPTQGRQIAIPAAETKVKSLEADIEQLKSMIVEMATGASAKEEGEGATQAGASEESTRVIQELASAGIEKKLARQIVRQVSFDLNPSEQQDEQAILDRVATHLVNDIKVSDMLEQVGARAGKSTSTVMALVGPTGVGKTTTIAKIASLAILEKRLRVGLINLDSYKVAAADQLATYAKIMNVPFRSVNTKEELTQAIYDFSSLDLVLIDTTGRSQKDQESLLQLRHMLASIEGVQSILLMSATTKDSDMNEVVSRFKIFHPIGLVFSKLDETSVYGCIYNTQKRTGLPLLYFTVGQRVPEDIEKASAERVVDLVLDL
jgi:flagellar biosynthesis protein FlhF